MREFAPLGALARCLVLEELGVPYGFGYGLVLTAVSGIATFSFIFFIDRGRTITGAAAGNAQKTEIRSIGLERQARNTDLPAKTALSGD